MSISTRDYFACHAPKEVYKDLTLGAIKIHFGDRVEGQYGSDEQWLQMKCELRYQWGDAMIKASHKTRDFLK